MENNASRVVALVTGGAQGIGRAIAQRFLQGGMNVVIADCDAAACEETEAALSPLGGVAAIPCDVSVENDVKNVISRVSDRFGRLDTLVCNAGITPPGIPVTGLSLEQWRRVIDVNLTGCFLCVKYAVPLLEQSNGSIITMASTRHLQSEPHTEPYSASKGGIVALTHALAISLGPKIRVNCISPGWIETADWKKQGSRSTPNLTAKDHAQHPAGRVGTPPDIAAMAVFLASPEAGFITGQNFVIDGGMTRKMIYVE